MSSNPELIASSIPRDVNPNPVFNLSPALHNFVLYMCITLLCIWAIHIFSDARTLRVLKRAYDARNIVRLDGLSSFIRDIHSISRASLQQILTQRSTFTTKSIEQIELPFHILPESVSLLQIVADRSSPDGGYLMRLKLACHRPAVIRLYTGLLMSSVQGLYSAFREQRDAIDAAMEDMNNNIKKWRKRARRPKKEENKRGSRRGWESRVRMNLRAREDSRANLSSELASSSSMADVMNSASHADVEMEIVGGAKFVSGGFFSQHRTGDALFDARSYLTALDPLWVPACEGAEVHIHLDASVVIRAAGLDTGCYFIAMELTDADAHSIDRFAHAQIVVVPTESTVEHTNGDEDDASKDDARKDDAFKNEDSKDDDSKDDDSKDDASKDDASKDDASKDDARKDDAFKNEDSKDDDSKEEENTGEAELDGALTSLQRVIRDAIELPAEVAHPIYDVTELTLMKFNGHCGKLKASPEQSTELPGARDKNSDDAEESKSDRHFKPSVRVDRQMIMSQTLVQLLELENVYGIGDPENLECTVCFTEPKDMIMLPCRHCCVCHECLELVRGKCPVCRSQILSFMRFSASEDEALAAALAGQMNSGLPQ